MVLLVTSLGQGLIIALFSAVLGSVLAWGVGNAVSYLWDERKRRRESDLEALATFYQVYGDFFATWKLWSAHKRSERKGSEGLVSPDDVQWRLLERAGAAEGGFEALLVKLVSERRLDARDRRLLGCFREAYQMLREAIRDNEPLEWRASQKKSPRGFEQYRAFKSLAEYVAFRLKEPSPRPNLGARAKSVRARLASTAVTTPTPEHDAVEALLDITHRAGFHGQWWKIATKELRSPYVTVRGAQTRSHRAGSGRQPGV